MNETQETSLPTPNHKRIDEIEAIIHRAFETNSPLDTALVKELSALRLVRLDELITEQRKLSSDFDFRLSIVQANTRALTGKLDFTDTQLKLHPQTVERLFTEMDAYDDAAVEWLGHKTEWQGSKPESIAAGILIIAADIR